MISNTYIAGFFDGEGSIGVYKNGNGTAFLRTQLTQNVGLYAERLLESAKRRWGGNVNVHPTTHGEAMNWQLCSEKAIRFLGDIERHLILKKEQAEVVRLWWASRPKQRRGKGGTFVTTRRPIDEGVIRLVAALKRDHIDAVMAAQSDLVEVVRILRQVVCVKG